MKLMMEAPGAIPHRPLIRNPIQINRTIPIQTVTIRIPIRTTTVKTTNQLVSKIINGKSWCTFVLCFNSHSLSSPAQSDDSEQSDEEEEDDTSDDSRVKSNNKIKSRNSKEDFKEILENFPDALRRSSRSRKEPERFQAEVPICSVYCSPPFFANCCY